MKTKIITAAIVTLFTGVSAFAGTTMLQEYYIAANDLAERGIISEKSMNEDYRVMDHVLRQEIAAVARGVAKLPKKETCDNIFTDVSATNPNTWACYSIEPLIDNNLISGNTTFRPEDKITKSETLGMLIKAIGFDYSYNPDSTKGWQEQIVDFAVENDVLEEFIDYNTEASRGWVFNVANHVIEIEEERTQMKEKEKELMSDEAM